ncbi:helix-turn-helix transcriptional regulator [Dyadobacter sp. CY345]|uniref:helix-turn-helix domain-containing protein n=1 Tax=Dyadobacter sp. CY345 TaxID=2909335 RepID=UPI001F28A77F|nr:response regulator transcription factor [Dyadobacter sp. CY345]MCF2447173.1 helix-turn-helix transcriptional regulator [Dyadobacter sp. CY345]
MIVSESIEDFYKTHPGAKLASGDSLAGTFQQGHFNIFSRKFCNRYNAYSRRDYYKISLIIGKGKLLYGDTKIDINQNALVFFNRNVPYSWETSSEKQSGYFCLFNDDFLNGMNRTKNFMDSPISKNDTIPVYFINEQQEKYLLDIYQKMAAEMESNYVFKYDLVKNYVNLIIHEAVKMQSSQTTDNHVNGSSRIASCFSELMERQFPIDSPEHKLQLRTAKDYAQRLSIHINHLNRALKEVTGKTTTEHITERLIQESKILLKKSNWSIAEIAYCLGFEYPEYFNNLFKKQTGITPNSFRK